MTAQPNMYFGCTNSPAKNATPNPADLPPNPQGRSYEIRTLVELLPGTAHAVIRRSNHANISCGACDFLDSTKGTKH